MLLKNEAIVQKLHWWHTLVSVSPSSVIASAGRAGDVKLTQPHGGDPSLHRSYQGHGTDADIDALAFSPDGLRVASASNGEVHVWNVEGERQAVFTGHRRDIVQGISWSPDSKRIVSGGSEIYVWEAETGQLCFTCKLEGIPTQCSKVAWSPDGTRIAAATFGPYIGVWDAEGRVITDYNSGRSSIFGPAFSPDGRELAIGSDGESGVSVLSFDSDGGMREVARYKEHGGSTWDMAWSPDGNYIASCGYKNVHVWTIGEGAYLIDKVEHNSVTHSVSWSLQGDLVVGDADGCVNIWPFVPYGNIGGG